MTSAPNEKNGRRLFPFLKKGEPSLEIEGYHVGNILSKSPVLVRKEAAVVGNILAPKIVVQGAVYGACFTPEIQIRTSGVIWGDLHTIDLNLEVGGKIHGWVNSIEMEAFESIAESGTLPTEVILSGKPIIPVELETENILDRGQDQTDLIRMLQSETAVALAARKEIEAKFSERVSEIAGEAAIKVEEGQASLIKTQDELKQTKSNLVEAEETVASLQQTRSRLGNELELAQNLLSEKTNEAELLSEKLKSQVADYEELQASKAEIEISLHNTGKELDTFKDRIKSLETALQTSLQHTAEQEDSLIHWQELVESKESEIKAIEQELQQVQLQLEESSNITEMMRAQRQLAEEQWNEAVLRIDELSTEVEIKSNLDDNASIKTQALDEAIERITELETALAEADETAQEYMEQHLWVKASLKTAQIKLDETLEKLADNESRLLTIENDLTEKSHLLQQREMDLATARERLDKQEQAHRTAVAELDKQINEVKSERDGLQESILHMKIQVEAFEAEIDHHLGQINAQGQRLAEAQAMLVERDLQIQDLHKRINKQADFIKRMKAVTSKRIEDLKEQLSHIQQGQSN